MREKFSAMVVPHATAIAVSMLGMLAVLAWRVREARGAVSVKKIVMPPVGMATGFSMFIVPAFRVPLTWAGIAFLTGALALAYPLLLDRKSTRLNSSHIPLSRLPS